MAIHLYKTSTPSTRNGAVDSQVKSNPRNNLIYGQHRCGKGRNARGIITAGHRGGGHKRLYRKIDFRRNEKDIYGRIVTIEYDPCPTFPSYISSFNSDSSSHLFGTPQGAGTAILTLLGGFHPQTQSLWLTDIAHHHLAIAILFLIAGHMYRTNFGIGHSIKEILEAHIPPGGRLGRGHKGLYDTINNSLHFQLGLALASLGVITSLVAQHMYSLPAYAFIAQDFI
ncbi:hypothetical protein HN51_059190 [Arachis hypogaea]